MKRQWTRQQPDEQRALVDSVTCRVVEGLRHETGQEPPADVLTLAEQCAWTSLRRMEMAQITTYLPVLVERDVRRCLREGCAALDEA